MKIRRQRTITTNKLKEPTALELNKALNMSYQEFLHVFYLSSQDSAKLLEPAYFRNFLIKLFDLEQYTKIYDKLKLEYNNLSQVEEHQKVNRELYIKRFERIKKVTEQFVIKQKQYQTAIYILEQAIRKCERKQGEVNAKNYELNSKEKRVRYNTCPVLGIACKILEQYKNKIQPQINEARKKLAGYNTAIIGKIKQITDKQNKLQDQKNIIDNRVLKGRTILYTIKEKLKVKPNPNIKRIKELEQIMPIFSNIGFPAHLLQVYIPVIQETANSLITTIFPDMSIRIRPFRPNSHLPDFKVLVTLESKEVELTDCCGSEISLVNICLRLGVAIMWKQLRDTIIDMFLVDENLEQFDNENSLKVIKLFENFIKLGYIKQVIAIAHKDVLKNLPNVNYIKL